MPELRTDQLVLKEPLRQPRESFSYAQPRQDTAVALAIAEPPPPAHSDEKDAADPAARLEHCISLQAKAISLLECEQRVFHESGRPTHLVHTDAELLALLKEAVLHESNIVQDYRALRAEVGSLRTERDELGHREG